MHTITNTSSTRGKLVSFYKKNSENKYELVKLLGGDSVTLEASQLDHKAWNVLGRLSVLDQVSIESTETSLLTTSSDTTPTPDISLSIIIPTFNNMQYLLRLAESIHDASRHMHAPPEVIFGVDKCEDTLGFMRQHAGIFSKYKIYYFYKNVGPYIVKNTLAAMASSERILFFDSDDILMPNSLRAVYTALGKGNLCLLKFVNFFNEEESKTISFPPSVYAPGIIGVKRSTFLSMNGYQPWRCGADTEFKARYIKRVTPSPVKIDEIVFKRRVHENSLTKTKETGMQSPIRAAYTREIELLKSRSYPNPNVFNIESDVKLVALD